jgi:hypothetical protein
MAPFSLQSPEENKNKFKLGPNLIDVYYNVQSAKYPPPPLHLHYNQNIHSTILYCTLYSPLSGS